MRDRYLPRITPVEIAVVAIILVVAVAMASVMFSRMPRTSTPAAYSQLRAVTAACESYHLAFNAYPGYFTDASLSVKQGRDLTGSESMMLCLLGGVVETSSASNPYAGGTPPMPTGWTIDPDRVGTGPRTDKSRQYGAFYSPRPGELFVVTGTTGLDNPIPDLVEAKSGMPILYYRIDPNRTVDRAGAWYDGNVALGRETNGDYFNATQLTGPNGSVDQSTSLLRASQPGGTVGADALLTAATMNRKVGVISDGFLLLSPGADGVYFDSAAAPRNATLTPEQVIDAADDVVMTGGC